MMKLKKKSIIKVKKEKNTFKYLEEKVALNNKVKKKMWKDAYNRSTVKAPFILVFLYY
jgi:hypothetical protein